jgi:hypothetical protein
MPKVRERDASNKLRCLVVFELSHTSRGEGEAMKLLRGEGCKKCRWIEPFRQMQCGHPSGMCVDFEHYEEKAGDEKR